MKSQVRVPGRSLFKLLRLQGDNLGNVLLRMCTPILGITLSAGRLREMCKITFSYVAMCRLASTFYFGGFIKWAGKGLRRVLAIRSTYIRATFYDNVQKLDCHRECNQNEPLHSYAYYKNRIE